MLLTQLQCTQAKRTVKLAGTQWRRFLIQDQYDAYG